MPPIKPGNHVKELMNQRHWSQAELAYVLGVTTATVNQVVNSKRPITPEMAKLLGVAFERPAEEFADLQSRWSLANAPDPDDEVQARASAQSGYPLREMVKRGWINDPKVSGGAHGELCRFFGVNSLDGVASLGHAAKKSGLTGPTGEQLAWLYRVRAIAAEMPTPEYSRVKFFEAIERMSAMRTSPEELRHIPRLLNEAGVRFVVVEGLKGGKIDGVCTWLDDRTPVIGMSLRYDRIDNFWFVLRHECAHVLHGHGKTVAIIDSDLSMSTVDVDEEEALANKEAADFCIASDKIRSFYVRKNPFFSDADVVAFAKINKVHPGLVVGQIHHMTGEFRNLRQYLVNIRKFVTSSAMTDGYGQFVPVS